MDRATQRFLRHRMRGGFGALSTSQLALADDALEAARRGRSIYEFWKPTITDLEAQRGWMGDERVGPATLMTFLKKAEEVAGPKEWATVYLKWKTWIDDAQASYDKATEKPDLFKNPLTQIETIVKWGGIALGFYLVLRVMKYIPPPKHRNA